MNNNAMPPRWSKWASKKSDKLDDDFTDHFNKWMRSKAVKINYDHSRGDIIANVMKLSMAHMKERRTKQLYAEQGLTYPSPI
jgi:hypothetical protein